jgi:hypothetical protein
LPRQRRDEIQGLLKKIKIPTAPILQDGGEPGEMNCAEKTAKGETGTQCSNPSNVAVAIPQMGASTEFLSGGVRESTFIYNVRGVTVSCPEGEV